MNKYLHTVASGWIVINIEQYSIFKVINFLTTDKKIRGAECRKVLFGECVINLE